MVSRANPQGIPSHALVDLNLGPLQVSVQPPPLTPAPPRNPHRALWAETSTFSTFQKCVEILCLLVVSLVLFIGVG